MASELDRLFREGLDPYEAMPKAQSWQEVQNRLSKKKRVIWVPVSVAAAITLLITAAILIKNQLSEPAKPERLVAIVDFPKPPGAPAAIRIQEEVLTTQHPGHLYSSTEDITPLTRPTEPQKEEPKPLLMAELKLTAIHEVRLAEVPTPQLKHDLEEIYQKKTAIKITYVAENNRTGKKQKLTSLISTLSKEASPIEILADLRDAKDQIFSRN